MSAEEVEKLWDGFIPRIGGCRVLELIGANPTASNADYLFRQDNVIAELKVLTADLVRTDSGQDGIAALMASWRERGLYNVVFYGTRLIQSRDLPEQCQQELAEYFGKRLSKVISDANKQIRSTKSLLKMDDAFGLLLLVNDGSYHLHPDMLTYVLSRALRPRFDDRGHPESVSNKSIDNVLALTITMSANAPSIPEPVQLWLPAFRDTRQIPDEFLNRIADGWFNYLADVTGAPVRVYATGGQELIRQMKFTGEGRKPASWKKK